MEIRFSLRLGLRGSSLWLGCVSSTAVELDGSHDRRGRGKTLRRVVWVPAPLELLALVQGGREKGGLDTAGVKKAGFQLAFIKTGQI